MASSDESLASGKRAGTNNSDALPQFPGEDFLAHAGKHYKEQLDARLAEIGLLPVAQGFEPDSVKFLKDYDLSA